MELTEKQENMTDFDDDLFDDAQSTFPSKDDLRDRLCAIWTTGEHGQRKSEATGKPYDWVETIVLVLDGEPTDLVGPAPARVDKLQFSFTGATSRLMPRLKISKPMLGRVNSQPNKRKGFADSWSIAEPTEDDKVLAKGYAAQIKAISAEVEAMKSKADDDSAFD